MPNLYARMQEAIAERDRLRGRSLSDKEQLDNLTHALGECDSDCASFRGDTCDCGGQDFKAKFGPGRYTP